MASRRSVQAPASVSWSFINALSMPDLKERNMTRI